MPYYLLVILLLTIVFAILYRSKVVKFCPVCAAAVATWIFGLLAIHLHISWANPIITTILMGASMGAVAEKYGKNLGFLWKTAVVLLGLPAIYFLAQPKELYKGLALIAVLASVTFLLNKAPQITEGREDLFKDCC